MRILRFAWTSCYLHLWVQGFYQPVLVRVPLHPSIVLGYSLVFGLQLRDCAPGYGPVRSRFRPISSHDWDAHIPRCVSIQVH